jgi:hypothetical protein
MRSPGFFQRPDLRDAFLMLIGALSLLLGYAYGVAHIPKNVHTALYTATLILPLKAYAAAWIASGVYCVVAGLSARHIGGFTAAVLMPTVWGAVYMIGWVNGDTGRGWVTACIFWALAGAVYCVSGLVDPTPIARPLGEDR